MRNLKQFEEFAKGKPNKEKSSNTCVIYTRVSTKEQAENNMPERKSIISELNNFCFII